MEQLGREIEECKTQEELYDLLKGHPEWIILALRPIILKRFDELKKKPIDELCQCGHSKKCHGITNLDKHGGECNQCKCDLYTWKEFVFENKDYI